MSSEISEAHATSLSRAGVPAMYHNLSLHSMGSKGERVVEWLQQNAHAVKYAGLGATMNDPGLFMMTARALHLLGVGVRVVSPAKLRAGIAYDRDGLDVSSWHENTLFIRNFYTGGVPPWDKGWERHIVEEFLAERMETNGAVFVLVHARDPIPVEWWTPQFLQLVSKSSPELAT